MRRTFLVWLSLWGGAFAQQSATVSGTIAAPEALPENARIGVHIVDANGVWGREIGTSAPEDGSFSVELSGAAAPLAPLRSDEVVLPGLQHDYSLSPEVNFTRAQINVYLDENGNGTFDRTTDVPYLGLAGTASPTGFFVPLYVDQDATLEAAGETFALSAGWNIFTVRFPEGEAPQYGVSNTLDSARLDVFPGQP
jgi:hypothetical protein